MEPIRHTKTARLRGLRMYRENLDDLVRLFQKCASATISDNKNNYVSLDEMKRTIGSKIVNLDIRGERPGVHFLLNQKEYQPGSTTPTIFNELRTEETTDAADNLFREIKDFLLTYQRPNPAILLIPALICIVGSAVVVTYAMAVTLESHRVRGVAAVLGSLIVTAFFTTLGIASGQNRLFLETKLNSPSFLVRNKEDFAKHAVTSIISGILGLFFGLIGGWLLGHYG